MLLHMRENDLYIVKLCISVAIITNTNSHGVCSGFGLNCVCHEWLWRDCTCKKNPLNVTHSLCFQTQDHNIPCEMGNLQCNYYIIVTLHTTTK